MNRTETKSNEHKLKNQNERASKLNLKTRPIRVRILPDGTVITTSEYQALLE